MSSGRPRPHHTRPLPRMPPCGVEQAPSTNTLADACRPGSMAGCVSAACSREVGGERRWRRRRRSGLARQSRLCRESRSCGRIRFATRTLCTVMKNAIYDEGFVIRAPSQTMCSVCARAYLETERVKDCRERSGSFCRHDHQAARSSSASLTVQRTGHLSHATAALLPPQPREEGSAGVDQVRRRSA